MKKVNEAVERALPTRLCLCGVQGPLSYRPRILSFNQGGLQIKHHIHKKQTTSHQRPHRWIRAHLSAKSSVTNSSDVSFCIRKGQRVGRWDLLQAKVKSQRNKIRYTFLLAYFGQIKYQSKTGYKKESKHLLDSSFIGPKYRNCCVIIWISQIATHLRT